MRVNGLKISHRVQLRRSDIDRLGHVTNTIYHQLFTEARAELLDAVRTDDRRFVVARSEVDFMNEIRLSDGHVDITVWTVSVGNRSVTLDHELRLPDGRLSAQCRTVVVAWDVAGRRSRQLTDAERITFASG